jgi:hypothetical protein
VRVRAGRVRLESRRRGARGRRRRTPSAFGLVMFLMMLFVMLVGADC